MRFQDASDRYMKWAKQFEGSPVLPSEACSEQQDGNWHLANVDGPLAVVMQDGKVVPASEVGK